MSKVLNLTKTIKTFSGAEVSQITFREPTGDDLIHCGMPWAYEMDDQGRQTRVTNTRAVGRYIERLCGVEAQVAHMMAVPDFLEAVGIVSGFFLAPAPKSQSSTGISP